MNILGWIKGWHLERVFKSIKKDAAKVAISITETVKYLLDSGTLTFIADLVSKILPSTHDLPQELIAALNKLIPKILAVELAVQGLPDNPNEGDILVFESTILEAFNVYDKKSKLYTTLAAQIYGIMKNADKDADGKLTFAELVAAVEEAYQDYIKDKADADKDNTL